ncbi:hypothetical protein CDG79_17915 [Nostoc sp. 'Peltigera membranacea cyanobiont' 232]|nr:hypothetical protein CDG79_17915 [Nostoc sp. 'Peltigera membranacea cyanobiont' 232]
MRYGHTKITNAYAEITNAYAEITNAYTEITNEYAELRVRAIIFALIQTIKSNQDFETHGGG